MISPDKVPTYTGDIGAVEVEVGRLRKAAQSIREHGGDVNTRFRHLSGVYRAPEAEYLFQTTQGVHDTSASFASKVETVAGALETYACEIRPLVDKLERLRSEAAAFVASVQGQGDIDPKWHHDKAKMAAHNALMHEVAATVRAFQDAEVAAADAITSVVHGTEWNLANGSPKQSNPYGFSNEQLNGNDALPWGTPEHFSVLPFELDWHIQQFGESLGDNIKGTVTGLVDLFRPGEKGQETRKGLLMTIVGAEDYLRDPDGNRPMDPIGAAGRPYAKAFGKSLVGWDDWKTNPGKASATVVFNVLTFASGPLGAASKVGAAGKAGEAASVAARTAGVLSKAGEVLDPIGATAKVVGTGVRALPKVSELTKSIAAVTKVTSETHGVHSIIDLKGGSKLHVGDGEFTISKDGIPDTTPAPHELPADQRIPSTTPAHEHELVGVGGRAPEASAHAGENLPPQASHGSTSRGGGSGTVHGSGQDGSPSHGRGSGIHGADSSGGSPARTPHQGSGGSSSGHGGAGSSGHSGAGSQGSRADWPERVRRQVEKANDPDQTWRKAHYGTDGRRLREDGVDELDEPLTKLKPDPDNPGKFIPKIEKPIDPPKYHLGETVSKHRADATPENLDPLDKSAHDRHSAVTADNAFHSKVTDAEKAYAHDPTPQNKAHLQQVLQEHAPLHDLMGKKSEAFGERIAELQAVHDNYPGADWVDLAETPNGADRFDQVWRLDDGRYVVVEAKSKTTTKLGYRTLRGGKRVSQGTREYFEDILRKMDERGRHDEAEAEIHAKLVDALANDKIEYVLVKGKPDGATYAGYVMKKFNISLPKGASGAPATAAP
ncbi:hypothetical protein ACFYMW_18870 [Streptomyces sp. NPDC006692]|uniref:hypothetical protein n=1 Tax=Streptomyces sp. NPDC006692 TaxID=3364758 RepID=UPI003696B751